MSSLTFTHAFYPDRMSQLLVIINAKDRALCWTELWM